MTSIWHNDEHVGEWKHSVEPNVGDIVELRIGGETEPYEVAKVYNHFPLGNPVQRRVAVKYAGEGFLGML